MIYLNRLEHGALYYGGKVVSTVYNGALIVWSAIKSCFGAGYWNNEAPWSNTDAWKNS